MADDMTVTIDRLPESLEDYLALRDRLATTPEGGVAMYILAAHLYARDHDVGMQAFTVALDRKNLEQHASGYKGWRPRQSIRSLVTKLEAMPWAARTYLAGTRVEDGYALPSPPYRMEVFTNPYSKQPDGSLRLLVKTSGADSPRPFTVARNDKGIWKISGSGSSLFTGMKKPPEVVDDDL